EVPALRQRALRQIHFGGGTPTFFSPQNLERLLEGLYKDLTVQAEGSIEVDPRRTSRDHLKSLLKWGFDRVSMGVQDFNPHVQKLINRVQSFETTRDLTSDARDLGYKSINFDLIYGLPQQDLSSMV